MQRQRVNLGKTMFVNFEGGEESEYTKDRHCFLNSIPEANAIAAVVNEFARGLFSFATRWNDLGQTPYAASRKEPEANITDSNSIYWYLTHVCSRELQRKGRLQCLEQVRVLFLSYASGNYVQRSGYVASKDPPGEKSVSRFGMRRKLLLIRKPLVHRRLENCPRS